MKPYEKLQRHWHDADEGMPTAAVSEDRVVALERKYQVLLPDDFRDYLIHSTPSTDWADHNFVYWWPIERIKNIPEEYKYDIKNDVVARDAAHYLFFADWMIWCAAWAISCGSDNRGSVVVFLDGARFVADSFSQFVDCYIASYGELL